MDSGQQADRPRPIPVLLLVRELGIGGCENDLTKLATGIDRSRFEPHVACIHARGIRLPQLEAARVPIVELPIRGLMSPSWFTAARVLREYVRDHRIEILHAFDAPMDVVAIPMGWLSRVPVLIKSHLWYRDPLPRWEQLALAATDRMVDAFVVNSRAAERDLVTRHGVAANRVHLCYNGVDTDRFNPSDRARDEAHPLTIGTVCALRHEKRVDLLLSAVAAVREHVPDVRVLIVGSGPMHASLERQCRTLGLDDVTHFEPTTSEVPDWMRRIDVFVLSSETESFPNALLEAMACGCCVVASRVGGVPELVRDGHNGLLFDAGDAARLGEALKRVTADVALRHALGDAAARAAIADFSVGRFVRRMEEIYDGTVARGVGAATPRRRRSGSSFD